MGFVILLILLLLGFGRRFVWFSFGWLTLFLGLFVSFVGCCLVPGFLRGGASVGLCTQGFGYVGIFGFLISGAMLFRWVCVIRACLLSV